MQATASSRTADQRTPRSDSQTPRRPSLVRADTPDSTSVLAASWLSSSTQPVTSLSLRAPRLPHLQSNGVPLGPSKRVNPLRRCQPRQTAEHRLRPLPPPLLAGQTVALRLALLFVKGRGRTRESRSPCRWTTPMTTPMMTWLCPRTPMMLPVISCLRQRRRDQRLAQAITWRILMTTSCQRQRRCDQRPAQVRAMLTSRMRWRCWMSLATRRWVTIILRMRPLMPTGLEPPPPPMPVAEGAAKQSALRAVWVSERRVQAFSSVGQKGRQPQVSSSVL